MIDETAARLATHEALHPLAQAADECELSVPHPATSSAGGLGGRAAVSEQESAHRMRRGRHVRGMVPLMAERVYQFVVQFKRDHGGDSPTWREIAAGVDISSNSMVTYYLEALAAAGRIELGGHRQVRRIAIPGAEWRFDGAGGKD